MEMLLQSAYVPGQTPEVHLLPALPEAWQKAGRVKGLCVRGGFVVDFAWRDGAIVELVVRSRRDSKGVVRFSCGKKQWTVRLNPGQSKKVV